jgi:hypothetical protein
LVSNDHHHFGLFPSVNFRNIPDSCLVGSSYGEPIAI